MAYRLTKTYPPYEGDQPYLHLCFSDADSSRIALLLRRLYTRGVRVWYGQRERADRKAREDRAERMRGAALTVIFLTDAFRKDLRAKSDLLVCQNAGGRICCLNTDGGDGGLSIGLHPDTPEYDLSKHSRTGEYEAALLRAEGFSQELIGAPQKVPMHGLRIAAWSMAVAALVFLTLAALRFLLRKPEEPAPEPDTVIFSDPGIRESVRDSLGGGPLTEERLASVTVLTLAGDTLPDDLGDLALLPALSRIELTQAAARNIPSDSELYGYTLVLIGGGA